MSGGEILFFESEMLVHIWLISFLWTVRSVSIMMILFACSFDDFHIFRNRHHRYLRSETMWHYYCCFLEKINDKSIEKNESLFIWSMTTAPYFPISFAFQFNFAHSFSTNAPIFWFILIVSADKIEIMYFIDRSYAMYTCSFQLQHPKICSSSNIQCLQQQQQQQHIETIIRWNSVIRHTLSCFPFPLFRLWIQHQNHFHCYQWFFSVFLVCLRF